LAPLRIIVLAFYVMAVLDIVGHFLQNPFGVPLILSPASPPTSNLTLSRDHLYKHHGRPIQCPRCWEEFKSDDEFANHQNLDERCPQGEKRVAPGFDKEQEKLLRSKKKFTPGSSPDDTWRHIYKILFPDDEHIPRPCKYR